MTTTKRQLSRLAQIIRLVDKLDDLRPDRSFHSIRLYGDGSGEVVSGCYHETRLANFNTVSEALAALKQLVAAERKKAT